MDSSDTLFDEDPDDPHIAAATQRVMGSQTVGMFIQQYAGLGPSDFLETIKLPCLVVSAPQDSNRGAAGFGTIVSSHAKHEQNADSEVIPLRKRPGANSFALMITLGRALNNDIVVDHRTVSKFHLYFRRDAEGLWSVTDASSSNGTHVGGLKIKPDEPTGVQPGSSLYLGRSIRIVFYEPEALYQQLRNWVQ